jgi:hypothetical protein
MDPLETDALSPGEAEAELMEAAYGPAFRRCEPGPGCDGGVAFTVDLDILQCVLTISLPATYPAKPLLIGLDGGVTRAERRTLLLDLNQFVCTETETEIEIEIETQVEAETEAETLAVGSLDVCQCATEMLRDLQDIRQPVANSVSNGHVFPARSDVSIARFLIYFHHIMRYISNLTCSGVFSTLLKVNSICVMCDICYGI